jgi:hypothetical protein
MTEHPAVSAWRGEHAEQVRRAIALIMPEARWQDACREDVEMAIVELDLDVHQLRSDFHLRTKPAKRAAKRLALALRRVEVVLKDQNHDASVYMFFPRTELLKWTARCEEIAETPSGKTKRKIAEAKRLAVSKARGLLFKHGASDAADDATRGSRFCRLAALLYGDPNIELHNQCRVLLRESRKKSGSK